MPRTRTQRFWEGTWETTISVNHQPLRSLLTFSDILDCDWVTGSQKLNEITSSSHTYILMNIKEIAYFEKIPLAFLWRLFLENQKRLLSLVTWSCWLPFFHSKVCNNSYDYDSNNRLVLFRSIFGIPTSSINDDSYDFMIVLYSPCNIISQYNTIMWSQKKSRACVE